MIIFENFPKSQPYQEFMRFYKLASSARQRNIDAITISSYNKDSNEVDSRMVNLKYIVDQEWIFFSNYKSKKAFDFLSHSQISGLIFWPDINLQLRMKAKINYSLQETSDKHFSKRNKEKNALAISSKQSRPIHTYEGVIENYNQIYKKKNILNNRPSYWGGYSFYPYSFEFWAGHNSRLNKRVLYKIAGGRWEKSFLQP